jgi:hypothetical protein
MISGGLICSLAVSTVALAEGYYPQASGPGSINWPPPGGSAATQQRMPAYQRPANAGFRPYPDYKQQPRYRYRSGQKIKNELIIPPGEDWPDAAYYRPSEQSLDKSVELPSPGELRPQPVERGAPVEVVPPPSIPIEEVDVPLSEKPEHDWRPMKEQEQLQSLEETTTPPEPVVKSEPVMRKIEPKPSPLQTKKTAAPQEREDKAGPVMREVEKKDVSPPADTATTPLQSGMSIGGKHTLMAMPPAEEKPAEEK